MQNTPEENKTVENGEERPTSYGGFYARQNYEKSSRRWQTPLLAALFLLLFLLSTVGLVALFQGSLFTSSEKGGQSAGKVTVPVVNNVRYENPESAVAAAEDTLITVEVRTEEGKTVYGSGFILSREGYAVCGSALLEKGSGSTVTVYTAGGGAAEGTPVGSVPSLGVAVLQLEGDLFNSVTLGNSNFIRRGQNLYGVAPVHRSVFNGLVQAGTAVSTAENVAVTVRGEYRSIPVLYTSIAYDATLDGALVITEEGNAAGFLTGVLEGRGGGMTAIPIVTLVGLANEIINAN